VPEHYSWWCLNTTAGGAWTLQLVVPEYNSWWCLNTTAGCTWTLELEVLEHYCWWCLNIIARGAWTLQLVVPEHYSWWCLNITACCVWTLQLEVLEHYSWCCTKTTAAVGASTGEWPLILTRDSAVIWAPDNSKRNSVVERKHCKILYRTEPSLRHVNGNKQRVCRQYLATLRAEQCDW
jgi:hypothetical protein